MLVRGSDIRKRNVALTVGVLAVLSLVYLFLVTTAPLMSFWSKSYSNELASYENKGEGRSVSVSFYAPFDRLTGIGIDMADVTAYSDPVGRMDAVLNLTDSEGTIVYSHEVASVYEERFDVKALPLCKGEIYTLSLTVNDAEGIDVGIDDNGNLCYRIEGSFEGAPSKGFFTVVYLFFAALILMYLYYAGQSDDRNRDFIERVLMAAGVIMAVLFINQFYDLFMIAKSGLRMIDAVKAGKFFDYYDYAYNAELMNGSASLYYGYNYNVLLIIPVALLMIPFSFFTDGGVEYSIIGNFLVLYLNVIVAVLTLLAVKLTGKICDLADMPKDFRQSVRRFCIFSPLLLYITIAFGQLDILYVILMLTALTFYYRGRYRVFSLIMAFAVSMKLLPLMVFIPLILLVNKRVRDIVINMLICLSVKAVTMLLFERSAGYHVVSYMVSSWHGFTDKLFERSVGGVSLFIMLYAGICILCYISDVKADDRPGLLYRSMTVVFAVYAAFAAFVDWHPQWLIPLVLSLSFLVSFTGNNRILLLTAVLEPLLILESDTECNIVYMVEDGLLPVGDHKYSGVSFAGILKNASPFAMSFVRSVAAVILIYLAVFFYRRRDRVFGNGTVYAADRRLLAGRVIIFYAFLVFCFWCYCYIG